MKWKITGIFYHKKQMTFKMLLSAVVFVAALFLTACSGNDISSADLHKGIDNGKSSSMNSYEEDNGEFIAGEERVDESGEAWKVYEDKQLLVKEDICDQRHAVGYAGKGNDGVTAFKFALNGSYSLIIAYADEDTDIVIDSSFRLVKGKFKIVHIAPDSSVLTINETGEEKNQTITMKKGRNVIKLAGQGAKLKNLDIKFMGIDENKFENVYYLENKEYVDKFIMKEMKERTIEKEKVMEVLYLMDDITASQAFSVLLIKPGVSFSTDELCDIFMHSDPDMSAHWLAVTLKCGLNAPLSVNTLYELMPYLKRGGKIKLMNVLPQEDFFEGLKVCMPYLDSDELEGCLSAYFEAGGSMSDSQFDEIKVNLKESAIEKLEEFLP